MLWNAVNDLVCGLVFDRLLRQILGSVRQW